MHVDAAAAMAAIRPSLGRWTTIADIDTAAAALASITEGLKSRPLPALRRHPAKQRGGPVVIGIPVVIAGLIAVFWLDAIVVLVFWWFWWCRPTISCATSPCLRPSLRNEKLRPQRAVAYVTAVSGQGDGWCVIAAGRVLLRAGCPQSPRT